ncbi:MAG: pectate lyase [Paludibacter sp.]|nr:pectate lyase [Paludibacter sp.]
MKNSGLIVLILGSILLVPASLFSTTQKNTYPEFDLSGFSSSAKHWYTIYDRHNIINYLPEKPVYKPEEITKIADNIILFQRNNGGWSKNYDMQAILSPAQKDSLIKTKNILHTTFDNSTTYTQIEYLAKVYRATHIAKYKQACLKGLQFCIEAQYDNGGWPQYYPIEPGNYSRRITYNDGGYMGIMNLLKRIVDRDSDFVFIKKSMYKKITKAYNKGIECILNTQISENGKQTAWCQQHDEITLQPAWARAFEPPAICNAESSGIVLFLMDIQYPDKRVINAIQSAVKWFDESKIVNTKVITVKAPAEKARYGTLKTDRIVTTDSTAAPIWTRYYELGSHKPLFCDRNSKFLYSLSEVSRERRVGYGWYTYSPEAVLKRYPKWQKRWASENNVLKKE